MYQQRRLGALGIEWRPSSLKLAVGPDFSLDQDYQLQPLADLDVLVEPLPEFIHVMDWEPENEVQSDDNDSEYDFAEEYSTGEEQGNLSSTSSDDSECSAEDSEDRDDHKDGLRRSKRKKQRAEIMTSSGRCVKKRNLDEGDSNVFRNKQTRKLGNRQKSSRRKSSTSKSLRPQRAAALNARSCFSKITGTSTDGEDEDGSEGGLSESENALQDSNIDSEESSRSLLNEQRRHSKGKEVSLDKSGDATKLDIPESHENAGTRRRLVLKLPALDSSKNELMESTSDKCDHLDNLVGTSYEAHWEVTEGNGNRVSSLDQGCSSADAYCSRMERGVRGQFDKSEDHENLSDGIKDGKIRWGCQSSLFKVFEIRRNNAL